jgi:hypothetical protein
MDKKKIQRDAKGILDRFMKALDKSKIIEGEYFVERDKFEREEGKTGECTLDFKAKMLGNAPNKDDDFIIAEKGAWKK